METDNCFEGESSNCQMAIISISVQKLRKSLSTLLSYTLFVILPT